MRTTISLLASICLLTGCVNYPTVTKTLTVEQVPDHVLASFVRSKPGAAIEQVEVTTHRDHVVSYQVQFRNQEGKTFQVDFDRKANTIQYQRPALPQTSRE